MPADSKGWIALTLIKWEHLETNWSIPLHPRMEDGCVGFLPVFETREEAEAAHPRVPILQIQETDKEADDD